MRTRLLLAGLLVLALAGCTSGATPSPEPSAEPTPEPSVEPSAEPSAEPTQAVLDVKVTFDGEACTYLGPTVILEGTLVRFEYLPDPEFGSTSLLIYGVEPGTAWETIVERGGTNAVSDVPNWVYEDTASWVTGAGTMLYTIESVKKGLTNPHTPYAVGGYGLGCTTPDFYTENPDKIYHAALLTVAGP